MLYTPHFLTGSAIVNNIPNPLVGLPLAFLSHFTLDLIPHSDMGLRPGLTLLQILKFPRRRLFMILVVLAADGVLLLASFLWLLFSRPSPWYLILGGLIAILPDAIEHVLAILGVPLIGLQECFQHRVDTRYGFISYPVVCLIALAFL